MINNQIEFFDKKLFNYMEKIKNDSTLLIDEIIKKYSPVQIGEEVLDISWSRNRKVKIVKITLMVMKYSGYPGNRFSFSYEGKLLTKKGEIAKNRKAVDILHFMKNGKKYYIPSYLRLRMVSARMYIRN